MLLLQDGSLLAATINGFPLSTAKITEKRKIIEEIALADVKKVRHDFSHHHSTIIFISHSSSLLVHTFLSLLFLLVYNLCYHYSKWPNNSIDASVDSCMGIIRKKGCVIKDIIIKQKLAQKCIYNIYMLMQLCHTTLFFVTLLSSPKSCQEKSPSQKCHTTLESWY